MKQSSSEHPQSTLEEHLTNSIRRAKQKIYNPTSSNYQPHNQPIPTEQYAQSNKNNQEIRNRTSSMRINSNHPNERESKALVGALKALQERIVILQRQKAEKSKNDKQQELEKKDQEIAKLANALKEKELEIKKLNRVNSNLSLKNNDLVEKVQQLEDKISRYRPEILQQISQNHLQIRMKNQKSQEDLRISLCQKDLKLAEMNDKIAQLQMRNKLSHQTIQKLMKQLEQQKRVNMKWIKLLQQQIKSDPKQNNSLEGNKQANKEFIRQITPKDQAKVKSKGTEVKKEFSQLIKSNKEMYQTIQRNKAKMLEMGRQLQSLDQVRKEAEERYAKMKLLALEIVENVNKLIPNPNSHIKFLTVKIMKLENNHIESLRSYSNISRKSMLNRNSNSKDRKKSLKMSDLNSSEKKSHQRSADKSSKKTKKDEILLSHSEKKRNVTKECQNEIEQLQKQVNQLKRQHRNLVAKADKGNNQDEEINKRIQETATLYNAKKEKLDQLKKQFGIPLKTGKREQTLRV